MSRPNNQHLFIYINTEDCDQSLFRTSPVERVDESLSKIVICPYAAKNLSPAAIPLYLLEYSMKGVAMGVRKITFLDKIKRATAHQNHRKELTVHVKPAGLHTSRGIQGMKTKVSEKIKTFHDKLVTNVVRIVCNTVLKKLDQYESISIVKGYYSSTLKEVNTIADDILEGVKATLGTSDYYVKDIQEHGQTGINVTRKFIENPLFSKHHHRSREQRLAAETVMNL